MTVKAANRHHSPGRPGTQSAARASASYLKLAAAFPIRPLRSEAELDEAIRIVDRLLSRKKPLDGQEQGYFDSLSHEIERYETANVPMPNVSGAAMLRHLMEARDASLSEVSAATGIAVLTISSVLRRKRQLNRGHIEKLAACFGVAPGVFLT